MNSITFSVRVELSTPEHNALYNYIKYNTPNDTVWGISGNFNEVPKDLQTIAERLWEENMPSDEEGMSYLLDTDILSDITGRDIVTCDDELTILYDVWYEEE